MTSSNVIRIEAISAFEKEKRFTATKTKKKRRRQIIEVVKARKIEGR